MLAKILTDHELLKRFEAGDESAFEQLYTRYRARLWGMARRMGVDTQQAEDIFVEALAAVAVQARRGKIQGSFIGYALTTVHHRGLHVIQRSNEKKARAAVPLTLSLVASGPSPEEAVMDSDLRTEVSQAMESLPADNRHAIYLVDCQGLTYKEAALALCCSEATIKRRLRWGRRVLAELLGHLRSVTAETADKP